jgi:hypothetical protein
MKRKPAERGLKEHNLHGKSMANILNCTAASDKIFEKKNGEPEVTLVSVRYLSP